MASDDAVREQLAALGGFIREQRHRAELSLRELADRADISNPYLSQIERGLHQPSVRVLSSIAGALNLSAETLLRSAGLLDGEPEDHRGLETEAAIRVDPDLTDDQRASLLAVYRSYVTGNQRLAVHRDRPLEADGSDESDGSQAPDAENESEGPEGPSVL